MLAALGCGDSSERKAMPLAKDGIIDLRDWDFEKDGIVELNGQWRFVWEEFVEPMPSDEFREKYRRTIQVPARWHTQPHPHKPGELLPRTGYATYALEVQLPKGVDSGQLGLAVAVIASAATWAVLPGDAIKRLATLEQGVPGISRETSMPVSVRLATPLESGAKARLMLLLHVSNFRYAQGGIWQSAKIGLRKMVRTEDLSTALLNSFIAGVLFIFAFYHFLLFTQRREDKPSLYFAFGCGVTALRQWLMARFPQALGVGSSADGYNVLLSLEYMTMPLIVMSFGLFIHALLPGLYLKRFVQSWCIGLGGILTLLCIFTEPVTFSASLHLYQLHVVLCVAVILFYLGVRAYKGKSIARWMFFAFVIVAGGAVNDILYGRLIIETAFIAPFTFIAFVLMQSAILSDKAARAFKQVKHLGENLQKEVDAKTRNLTVSTREALLAKSESDSLRIQAENAKEEADILRKAAEEHAIELKEIDKKKTHFFQNISHELRTPLTLILNPLEEASQRHQDDKSIDVAAQNSRRLLRLVNQLLDFQKLEAGKQELKLTPINLSQFAHVCGDYFASACSSKEIKFSGTLNGEEMGLQPQPQPLHIQGEVDALEKVTFNFLSNALKYTPKGGQIELGLTTSCDKARLFIRDTGPGISPEGQTKLFQVFSQVDETTTRDYEGTGLGLALVKSLTEEMNGEVGVESEVGQGSTFWAEFPLTQGARSKLSLLLVDDDKLVRDSLSLQFSLLLGKGQVKTVASAEEARAVLKTTDIGCIICDARMPDEDGPSFLTFAYKNYPSTGRILLTGQADQTLLQQSINDARVDHVAYKPCDVDDLIQLVQDLIEKSGFDESCEHFQVKDWLLADSTGQTRVEDTGVFESLEAISEGSCELVLVVDDLPDMRNLIGNSLKKKNYRVATAPNGKRGVEIARQIRPNLIVTDWMMPVMSGPDLIKELKDDAQLNSVPIILLTAKSDEESKLLGTEVGADAFLGKPFSDQELGSIVSNLLSLKNREREVEDLNRFLTESVLKRYLPPALIEQIVDGEISMDKPAEMRQVTVLFSDLCGFTATSAALGPAAISELLNEYLTTMNDIIFKHGGTIDKFIGDAIMVMFGAPAQMDSKEQAERATACANEMQAAMAVMAKAWELRSAGHLKMRIGIHQGDAVVGNFGSDRRSDYTCIGPTVNLAARIESACKPGMVFVSEQLKGLLPEATAESVGEFELKGVDGKQSLYRLV